MSVIDSGEWVSSSNDVFFIHLVRDPSSIASSSTSTSPASKPFQSMQSQTITLSPAELAYTEPFHPDFTYPIFGEKEVIFGYKGLRIDLHLSSSSLHALLSITYTSKIESKVTPADDVEGALFKMMSSDYTKIPATFRETVRSDLDSFKPPGELLTRYRAAVDPFAEVEDDAVDFGVYRCTWKTPGFRELHRRMQLFILLYIEGGSYIQEDEDNWEFLVLFERRKRPQGKTSYHFAGYVSVYPFWCFPDKVRLRLSQFVILPPYHGAGHGSQLYSALYAHTLTLNDVVELTIEDPSETFEDLRDRNDLRLLSKQLEAHEALSTGDSNENGDRPSGKGKEKGKGREMGVIQRGAPIDKAWLEERRKEGKYAKRQFSRLIEMLLLKDLNKKDQAAYKAYRMHVKERLYRFNHSILSQIPPDQRKEKLQETYENVEADYMRLLGSLRKDGQRAWVDNDGEAGV